MAASTFQQKPNTGSIFKAKEKKSQNHPDGDGSGLLHCPHCHEEIDFYISSWRNRTKSGDPYSKLAFKPKCAPAPQGDPIREPPPDTRTAAQKIDDMQDDIPF